MPSELPVEQVETVAEGVKTPTVHQVKRIELASEPAGANGPLIGQAEIRQKLQAVGQKFGINPSLAAAVVKTESGFNTRAVSSDGHASKGLFQLLDSTGKDLLARGEHIDRPYDPFDPDLNIELGTSYLKYLHDIFKSPTSLPNNRSTKPAADDTSLEKLAVAAFNAGEGRVASAQHRAQRAGKDPAHYDNVEPFLPASTREYVSRVVSSKKLF
jgi:soluble lytic murein transglycosylase-like protein